jgi:PhnB protein
VTPQLTLDDAAAAIDWYKKALGAEEVARAIGPDGKIMHAEIRIGDSLLMLNDDMGSGKNAKAAGGSPASLWLYVEDCDALFNRAVAAGANVANGPMGQLTDQFWGDRSGTFTDPHGYLENEPKPFTPTAYGQAGSDGPAIVDLGFNLHVELGPLRLPPPRVKRRIAGAVRWNDGRALGKVRVGITEDRAGEVSTFSEIAQVGEDGQIQRRSLRRPRLCGHRRGRRSARLVGRRGR